MKTAHSDFRQVQTTRS